MREEIRGEFMGRRNGVFSQYEFCASPRRCGGTRFPGFPFPIAEYR